MERLDIRYIEEYLSKKEEMATLKNHKIIDVDVGIRLAGTMALRYDCMMKVADNYGKTEKELLYRLVKVGIHKDFLYQRQKIDKNMYPYGGGNEM